MLRYLDNKVRDVGGTVDSKLALICEWIGLVSSSTTGMLAWQRKSFPRLMYRKRYFSLNSKVSKIELITGADPVFGQARLVEITLPQTKGSKNKKIATIWSGILTSPIKEPYIDYTSRISI
ncbi:hypothetical protein PoB_003039700 [Plakobranchus ocellatus]|uniref:Uncharacterized protein n=1 Tax=Plakobranchus ocellatus TaxID=259542 RepID=A0AAV4A9K9_9GAST|nr:hypothetical protein PoB_003039700 [Plakobranchus ocellatus]